MQLMLSHCQTAPRRGKVRTGAEKKVKKLLIQRRQQGERGKRKSKSKEGMQERLGKKGDI